MFSCQNGIKSKFRARLLASNLEAFMTVWTSKLPIAQLNFDRAITLWVTPSDPVVMLVQKRFRRLTLCLWSM